MESVAIDLQRQMHNLDDDQHSSSLGFSLYVLEAFISSWTNKLNWESFLGILVWLERLALLVYHLNLHFPLIKFLVKFSFEESWSEVVEGMTQQ